MPDNLFYIFISIFTSEVINFSSNKKDTSIRGILQTGHICNYRCCQRYCRSGSHGYAPDYHYNAASIESQTYNNTLVSTRTVLDDLVYTLSQESHSMKIRQQDPETKLWSLCEIRSFLSNGGARSSIWILWSEIDVSYEAPTT